MEKNVLVDRLKGYACFLGLFGHVIVGTVCGLVFPVLAADIAKKVRFFNFFFFPAKAYPLKKGVKNSGK